VAKELATAAPSKEADGEAKRARAGMTNRPVLQQQQQPMVVSRAIFAPPPAADKSAAKDVTASGTVPREPSAAMSVAEAKRRQRRQRFQAAETL